MSDTNGNTPPRPTILLIHNGRTRFVELDIEILRQRHQVTELHMESRRLNPLTVARKVRSHDAVLGWFASWHTFFPMLLARVLHRGSILIIGGYDLASLRDIGYGHQRGGITKWLSRWTMDLARCLVTNAEFSREEAERNAGIPIDRIHVIYLGVPDTFGSLQPAPRNRMVLSVGNVDRANLFRKGHEPFVRAAAELPDVEFVLVGNHKDDAIHRLRAIATRNVIFTGRVSDSELLYYYGKASVYVQASRHEGFGLSVAEAMLAGCIPVVSKCGALPEVVGDCGIYLDTIDPQAIAKSVSEALEFPDEARLNARTRVLREFTISRRQESFEALLEGPEPWP